MSKHFQAIWFQFFPGNDDTRDKQEKKHQIIIHHATYATNTPKKSMMLSFLLPLPLSLPSLPLLH
jgi:hypothetical protein